LYLSTLEMSYLKGWLICARAFRVLLIFLIHFFFFSFQSGEAVAVGMPISRPPRIDIKGLTPFHSLLLQKWRTNSLVIDQTTYYQERRA
jgi:hypothetical protein